MKLHNSVEIRVKEKIEKALDTNLSDYDLSMIDEIVGRFDRRDIFRVIRTLSPSQKIKMPCNYIKSVLEGEKNRDRLKEIIATGLH